MKNAKIIIKNNKQKQPGNIDDEIQNNNKNNTGKSSVSIASLKG